MHNYANLTANVPLYPHIPLFYSIFLMLHSTVEGVFVPRACFGAGCYWGTQKFFEKFIKTVNNAKLVSGAVGFMGPEGAKANPTYREVCSGTTGHVEVYDLEFEGDAEVYEQLVRYFFQFHDPTTSNRQVSCHRR
jgi:methionine-S-sulfoxide reductase